MAARVEIVFGLAGLGAAFVLLAAGLPWVKVWFYDLAWYSWLVALDGLAAIKTGRSLIRHRPRELALLAVWSVFVWLVFENFNFRLLNWRYLDLPPQTWLRWPGYAVAYATVLPALFMTERALSAWGILVRVRVRPIPRSGGWYTPFFVLGLAMFFLPLAWPRYFFPLVWGAFTFLLEPINHRLGARSLMADWERGEMSAFCRLLLAGFICGGLWEFFNFWAGAKWVYTVPFVGFLKVFEMPILGFLGFPAFAVECYVVYAFVDRLRGNRFFAVETGLAPQPGVRGRWAVLAATALWLGYAWLVMDGIDRVTVISFSG